MGVPRQIVQAYFGKQASKGTPAPGPAFTFPVTGGKPFNHATDEPLVELTGTSPGRGVADRVSVIPGALLPTLVWAKSVGVALYSVLGGYSVSGTNPYTHVNTPANEPLPYQTLWGRYNTDYVRILNAKCSQLVISFDGAGFARCEQTWVGTTSLWADTPSAATNDDTVIASAALRAAGGTFQLDIDGTTNATYCIRSGSVTINRNLNADMCAAAVTPDDNTAGVCEILYSLTVVPAATLVDIRNVVTGSPTGTAPSSVPVYGAAIIGLTDGTNTLTLASNRVNYSTETPDADPGGGSAEVVLAGRALAGAGVAQLTATLVNSVPSYSA
jgi:hypothetical protein